MGEIPAGALGRGRDAFAREAWSDACALLAQADREAPLEPEDLERLALAAYLIGEDEASIQALTRAYHGFTERGDSNHAARNALWLVFTLLDRPGQQAQASGWLARARRLLDDQSEESVEQGFLLCVLGRQKAGAGDFTAACDPYEQAARIGARFRNPDLA